MDFLVWLENSSVGMWINQSTSLIGYPGVILVHTLGLTLLAGIHIFVGLRILGFAPRIPVAEIQKLFPLMWAGMVLSVGSGALLLTAKATTMMFNPAFVIKMISIVLAVSIFFAMRAKVFRDPLLDKRPIQLDGKVLALMSMALWLVAITAGRLMAYVGEAAEFGALVLK